MKHKVDLNTHGGSLNYFEATSFLFIRLFLKNAEILNLIRDMHDRTEFVYDRK